MKSAPACRFLILSVALLLFGLATNGTPPAEAAITAAPVITGPSNGSRVTSFAPVLSWTNPPGVTQYHLQIIPANNDGPGVDLHIGSNSSSFAVPPPPLWYGLLPDITYTWRIRVSDAATFVELTDASWSPWAESKFRTPIVGSSTLSPLSPVIGDVVTTLTPSVMWVNSRTDVFYYEFQLSKDPTFNNDPATATAMIYSALLHGGVTRPTSSYTVPTNAALEDKTSYYWRMRPRVQGMGRQWSGLPPIRSRQTLLLYHP